MWAFQNLFELLQKSTSFEEDFCITDLDFITLLYIDIVAKKVDSDSVSCALKKFFIDGLKEVILPLNLVLHPRNPDLNNFSKVDEEIVLGVEPNKRKYQLQGVILN